MRRATGTTLIGATALIGLALLSGTAAAATITWNVGTGQGPDNFVVSTGELDDATIELGLRAQHRQSLVRPVLTGEVYSVETGHQGEAPDVNGTGAPSVTNRARWNFDLHVFFDGGIIANLGALRLDVNRTLGANTQEDSFDLLALRAPIDCHFAPGICASGFPGTSGTDIDGDNDLSDGSPFTPDPTQFYQGSQNPVFGSFSTTAFTPVFSFADEATYGFRLVALDSSGEDFVSRTMCVNVSDAGNGTFGCAGFDSISTEVSEPATLAIFGLGAAGLGVMRRRRKAA